MTYDTAQMFNASIASSALAAAAELGVLEHLSDQGFVDLQSFCQQRELHHPSVVAIARALACFDIVEITPGDGTIRPGPLFERAYAEKGYFVWLERGYGYLMHHLGELCQQPVRRGSTAAQLVRRDSRTIAAAGLDYGSRFVDPYFSRLLARDEHAVVADLGCGSAGRLLQMIKGGRCRAGVGIDIDAGAVELALANVDRAGFAGRIAVVCEDASALTMRSEYADVELLLSCFMGHDLWPMEKCRAVFERLPAVFPRLQRFLLCDTHRATDGLHDMPIFQLGFELTHAVMGQEIPSEVEWQQLFEASGWTCVDRQSIGIPSSSIFDLRPRSAASRSS